MSDFSAFLAQLSSVDLLQKESTFHLELLQSFKRQLQREKTESDSSECGWSEHGVATWLQLNVPSLSRDCELFQLHNSKLKPITYGGFHVRRFLYAFARLLSFAAVSSPK